MEDFWKWLATILAGVTALIVSILNGTKFKQERRKLRLENIKLEREIKLMNRKSKLEMEKLEQEIIKLKRENAKENE